MTSARKILITGGTDGIGLRLARQYSNNGADVAVTGRRSLASAKQLLSAKIHYIKADQSKPEKSAQDIINGLKEIGWPHCDLVIFECRQWNYLPAA